ncbi:hypothetical protein WAF17_21875 [Bernardetia sp. ABR2-2B]|uniref:hypothetical protein n=1 Tax=Bernardetia sp. ABR2-2B TaxID=3127472 RepID=UPI0030CCAF77
MNFLKTCIFLLITTTISSCFFQSKKNDTDKTLDCNEMIMDSPRCDDCTGYFGLYSVDLYGIGDNINRASGGIYKIENNIVKDLDGGSWFVNDLEFKKKMNGYGHLGFGGNKPDFDEYWGKTIRVSLNGNKKENIDSISTQLYLPKKVSINFKIDKENVSKENYYEPTKLKKGKNIIMTWNKDKEYKGQVLITMRFNKPLNYVLKNTNEFSDISLGKTWTPKGTMKRIVRTTCQTDNGNFIMTSQWFEDIDLKEIFWVYLSKRTSKKIKNENNTFMIFSDYDVHKSFRID